MSILLKQVKVINPASEYHHKVVDILIESGKITEIKKSISDKNAGKIIQGEQLLVSIGWFDLQATAGDPGFEHKENLNSLIKCAASGGYTGLALHSNNHPQFNQKAQIDYIISNTKNKIVDVYPLGTITNNGAGKELSEMYDMQQSGSKGFSNYKHPIKDAGTLYRALQYSNNINSLVMIQCNEESLSNGGQMNEGDNSTKLGLKGIPAFAEEIDLERNLSILEETGGQLHINSISTKGSVDLIKKAKSKNLKVTCGVSAFNMTLDDSCLLEFDSNYKLNPPLRTKKDVTALRSALESGLIDVVISDHCPQDIESKELEFDLAEFGAINLQTALPSILEKYNEKDLDQLIESITTNPRKILQLNIPRIEINQEANLTIFSQHETFVFDRKFNLSLSDNSPYMNTEFQSKVIGVINGTKNYFN